MYGNLLELLVAPIIVGVTIALFVYWLNNGKK
ncbi:type I toxin-antitoxin system Fst family toxin [Lacicoccus qingdaonensis]|nr:type I toxin-antitoxin system Fst family toxin [Salinicoccus qingdaonensis]